MSIITEVPEIRDSVALMSVDFYHASSELGWLNEDTELLRGVPIEKMSKSPEHEYFVRLFLRLIEAVLPDGHFVAKGSPLTTHDSEPEPDLMLVEGKESDFRKTHPTTAKLIIEVAINTENRDLSKADIYAEAGVDEFWLVVPKKQQIKVFRRNNGSVFESMEQITAGEVSAQAVSGLHVKVPSLFE